MMKRTRPISGLVVTAAAVLLAAAACGGGASSKGGGRTELRFGTISGPVIAFDPWLAPFGDNASLLLNQISYDSLTHVAPDGKITPGLATSWQLSGSNKVTLKLRDDAKFDDGTPVNAEAVKANFDYAKKAVPAGQRTPYIAALTTTVVDPTTLTLESRTPQPDLLTNLATGGGFIVNPKALKNPASLRSKPAGSGPYTLTSAVPGQDWVFTRRQGHWNPSEFQYQKLEMKNFSSLQAMDNALKTGQIDGGLGRPEFLAGDRTAGLNIHQAKPTTLQGIWLSDRAGKIVPALGEEKVRQALNYAVDRDAVMKAVFYGVGAPASLIMPEGLSGSGAKVKEAYSYDPAKAKKLLAEAGYPNGFTLPFLGAGQDSKLEQAVAGYLRQVGVKMDIKPHVADYTNEVRSGKWAATSFAWTMTPPAQSVNEILSPNGLGNLNHSTDPQISAALDRTQAPLGDAQTRAMEDLVGIVNDKAWFLIVGHSSNLYVTSKGVTCDIGQRTTCPLYTFRPAKAS
ncbi:hypothetical protein J4573_16435 [Actinomadura barringtoniae]|uniref:Solute-binding protein family 5 domain-containing protein n=1 Tax=Actinomadura barringtoniae TaxID=1427535 RepID=A0A939P9V3_9ACTN|nr:ABC transporter substrate-binding protein [Actinomadura barringtoniae]MBO2448691.1 hypothetical protein [Actinomadura barringtoniae]